MPESHYGSFRGSRKMSSAALSDVTDAPPTKLPPLITSVDAEIDHLGFGRFQVIALIILGLGNASDAVELLCLSFILPQLTSESGEEVSSFAKAVLSSGIFVGMLIGGLVFGVAADYLGRRSTLAFSLAINAFFGLLSAATPNYTMLLISRVVAGFGVGGSIPGVFTLAAEVLPTKDRGFWLSTVAWWWMVGSLYAAGFAWITLGWLELPWQLFATICAVPAALGSALVLLLLPESPRFLHTRGDVAGAQAALLFIAKVSGRPSRLNGNGWVLEPSQLSRGGGNAGGGADEAYPTAALSSVSAEGDGIAADTPPLALFAAPDVNGDASGRSSPAVRASPREEFTSLLTAGAGGGKGGAGADAAASGGAGSSVGGARRGRSLDWGTILAPMLSFFSPPHRSTAILLCIVWWALSFGWYGLILWIPSLFAKANLDLDVYQDSFLVAASNLPGNVVSALLMDRVGRKGVLCTSLIVACLCAAAFPFANTEATVLTASCMLNAVSTCSWNSLDCISTESFPTNLRTSSLGVLAAFGRLGSIAGQVVFGNLIDKSVVALLVTASIILGLGAAAAAALPKEEKDSHLHDT